MNGQVEYVGQFESYSDGLESDAYMLVDSTRNTRCVWRSGHVHVYERSARVTACVYRDTE